MQIGELESHNSELLRHTVECEGHCHQLREQVVQFDARWRAVAAENERMEREAGSMRLRLQARFPGPRAKGPCLCSPRLLHASAACSPLRSYICPFMHGTVPLLSFLLSARLLLCWVVGC